MKSSERVSFRELALPDAEALLAIYGDEAVVEHLSFAAKDLAGVQTLISGIVDRALLTPRSEYALAVIENKTNELIGMMRLALEPHRAAQIGFALKADRWGLGYGVEAVELALDFAFNELGVHRVWAARSPQNIASANLLKKVGLTDEGVIRDHVELEPGVFRDSVISSILEPVWRKTTEFSLDNDIPQRVRDAIGMAVDSGFSQSCSSEVGRLLSALASQAKSVLEIGTGAGVGSAWLAEGLHGRKLLTIEANEEVAEIARKCLSAYKGADVENASDIDGLRIADFDLVFVDVSDVKDDPTELLAGLSPGSLIVQDDYTPPWVNPLARRGIDARRDRWFDDKSIRTVEIYVSRTEAVLLSVKL